MGWRVVKEVPILQWKSRAPVTSELSCIYILPYLSNTLSNKESAVKFLLWLIINPFLLPSWMYSCGISARVSLFHTGGKSGFSWCAAELCLCVHFIWEEWLQSSKSTSPQGWGWRQAVMLSLRRKVAERIRTHTESISIEPLSSCAGFLRMTQLSCEEKWRGKSNRPAQQTFICIAVCLSNWCGLSAHTVTGCVQPVCPIMTDCCWSLRRRHWGELAHYSTGR